MSFLHCGHYERDKRQQREDANTVDSNGDPPNMCFYDTPYSELRAQLQAALARGDELICTARQLEHDLRERESELLRVKEELAEQRRGEVSRATADIRQLNLTHDDLQRAREEIADLKEKLEELQKNPADTSQSTSVVDIPVVPVTKQRTNLLTREVVARSSRSSTTGVVINVGEFQRDLLSESEYPLMVERPYLFLDNAAHLQHRSEKQQMAYLESTYGPAFVKGFLRMHPSELPGISKIFYNNFDDAQKAKYSVDGMSDVTYTLQRGVAKETTLFVYHTGLPNDKNNVMGVTESDMENFLRAEGFPATSIRSFVLDTPNKADWPCYFCGSNASEGCRVCRSWRRIGHHSDYLLQIPRRIGSNVGFGTRMEWLPFPSWNIPSKMQETSKTLAWRVSYPSEEVARLARGSLAPTLKNVSYQPDPFTQGLVICFRSGGFPRELFQKLMLHHPAPTNENSSARMKTGQIIQEFEYAPESTLLKESDLYKTADKRSLRFDLPSQKTKGDVMYATGVWETKSLGYARLITEHWWYGTLCHTMLLAALALMDLYSNLVYAAGMFNPQTAGVDDITLNIHSRYNFALSFLVLETLHIGRCWKFARKDLKSEITSGAGDIIRPRTRTDWLTVRIAAFVFYLIQMPRITRDIVRTLHPYTNMQPRAAAKLDGTRIFIIGYPSAHMYRAGQAVHLHKQIPPILLQRFILTASKVLYAYEMRNWNNIFLCSTGIILWPYQVYCFMRLINDRRVHYGHLQHTVDQAFDKEGGSEEVKYAELFARNKKNDLNKKQAGALNSWTKHFSDHGTLRRYSVRRDALSSSLAISLLFLFMVNALVATLQYKDVLHAAESASHYHSNRSFFRPSVLSSVEATLAMQTGMPLCRCANTTWLAPQMPKALDAQAAAAAADRT